MNEEKFFEQLKMLYERVTTLQKDTSAAPLEDEVWLPKALEELNTAFEELQVAQEELRAQNEALTDARQTIEAERQRYQDLFELAPDGYLVTDANGKIQEANSVAAWLLNVAPRFLVGIPLVNFITPSQRLAFRTQLNQMCQVNRVQDWEVRLMPRAPSERGAFFDVSMTVSAIRNRKGELVSLRWLLRDVTEHKQVLERLRLLESVVVNINEGILITETEPLDEPGPRIVYVNEAFTRISGYHPQEVLGFSPRFMQGPKTERAVLETMRVALERFEPVVVEMINYRKDGSEYWVELSLVPLMDETGCYTHWVSVQRDITEHKRAEEDRAQLLCEQTARTEAEVANRTKDEFLAIVSHELRSPLNAILGWARLLRSRKFDEQKTNKALETIERNAQAQTQIIEDLLDISRIIQGKVRLLTRPTNLVQIIEAAIDTVSPTANDKMIQVSSELDPHVGLLWGDPDRLRQIVWNLLSNAIKFTPVGGRIEVGLKSVNSYAQIQVTDTGIGISPEFLPYVFERFRQAESTTTRAHGGLGLGLAIVRNLVELHGGTIQVSSLGLGQGATFIVQLPLIAKDSGASHLEQLPLGEKALQANSLLDGLRVLIVDDEIDTREFMVTALSDYGSEVTAAASVDEALRLLELFKPDVLLCDISMPVEDGYALIRRVRALAPEQGGHIPAAAVTAYAREEDRILALKAGFQMHVPKPIEPMQLVEVVAKLAGMVNT